MSEELKYISYDEALVVYAKTVAASGGGLQGVKDEGGIRKVLDFVQNDLYYPTFVEKLTYLVFGLCTGHYYMGQFLRMIDHDIINFFVQHSEDFCDSRDNFLKDSPYLLCDRELQGIFGNIPEETTYSLIVAKAFCGGKDIILQAAQSCGGNLGCKAGTLTLSESQIGLAILEYNFKRPASGIYLPRLEEIQFRISCKQSIPPTVLSPADQKDPDRYSSECGIKHDVTAFKLAAVLLFPESFTESHKCGSREVSVSGMIFCPAVLSDLYHPQPMAFDMAAMDKPDEFLIGEPAVGQYITEPYTSSDGPFYHILCEFNLGHVVFFLPLPEHLTVVFGYAAPFEIPGAHAVVAFLALLSEQGEVEKNLRYSIGDCHAEAFESQNGLVGKMRMDSSYLLDCPACLLIVSIVKNQTYIIGFMVRTQMYALPKLDRNMPQCLSPVYTGIFQESVKYIFSCPDQWCESSVLLIAEGVPDPKAREQQKALEYGEQTVHTVMLVCDGKGSSLSHPDMGEDRTYSLHCCRHIRFFKKVFDIREKRSNFVYRHGFELVFWWYLKLLIFLQLSKNPCRFFMPLSLEISTCET